MAEAFGNRGALHRQLGVPEDEPIPQSKLTAAKNKARAQIEAAEKAGRKAPKSAVRTVRRVALAQRAKSGDISKMDTGGIVAPVRSRDLVLQGLEG
ncbi:MAG: hypothetical protein ACOY58_04725 [Candidatus Micrarchaeota archaeon]